MGYWIGSVALFVIGSTHVYTELATLCLSMNVHERALSCFIHKCVALNALAVSVRACMCSVCDKCAGGCQGILEACTEEESRCLM